MDTFGTGTKWASKGDVRNDNNNNNNNNNNSNNNNNNNNNKKNEWMNLYSANSIQCSNALQERQGPTIGFSVLTKVWVL